MKQKCRRCYENCVLFSSAFQYENRKCCSIECVCTCSAIFLKTIQAVSFLKLCSIGTSRSFNGACFVIYCSIGLCILRRYIAQYTMGNSTEREYDDEYDVMKEKMKKGNQFGQEIFFSTLLAGTTNTFMQNVMDFEFECIGVDKFSNLNPYMTGFCYHHYMFNFVRMHAYKQTRFAQHQHHHHQTTDETNMAPQRSHNCLCRIDQCAFSKKKSIETAIRKKAFPAVVRMISTREWCK